MNKKLDFKTMNILLDEMKHNDNVNSVESEYIAMNLYNYLYKINANQKLSDDFEFPISEYDLELVINKSKKYEEKYKKYQLRMLLISIVVIIAIFIIQFFVIKANIWLSLIVSLSLGLMDLYFLNKTLFPKYLKIEEKKFLETVSPKIIRLCQKLM